MLNSKLFQKVTKDINGKRSGLKHTEYPEFISDMKASVREFNDTVSRIIMHFNNSTEKYKLRTKDVKNNWQNSGYYNPYFWNKVLLYDNDYDGLIIWFVFNIEGLRITIGTTGTLESINNNLATIINDDIKSVYTDNINGFDIKMDNIYTSYLYTRDEIDEEDFVQALSAILPIYKNIFTKYKDRIFNIEPVQNNIIDASVEYLISKFKNNLRGSMMELKTNSRNMPFNVVLKNGNITAITNNNQELNIERDTKQALQENNFSSRGGLSYAPVVAKYIKDNFSNKDELIKIKNIILYGSPGVGKTHNTKKFISLIESGVNEKDIFKEIRNNSLNNGMESNQIIDNIKDRVKFITFHQSFGYEDFIEGFRPNEDGDIKLQDGIFKTICDDANNDRDHSYYLVIDEINRGNISKIFGELITLIEEDKRDTPEVILPYSKKSFNIPSNLYIIGTMNSTDKSIALIDIALRRRFTFLKMKPKSSLVKNEKAKKIMEQLNEKITETLGADYVLGHSYFMKIENDDDLKFVLEYKIVPLLEEYFYGDKNGYEQVIQIVESTLS